jgi:hypothetical protein
LRQESPYVALIISKFGVQNPKTVLRDDELYIKLYAIFEYGLVLCTR